jgi:hypothetical protein
MCGRQSRNSVSKRPIADCLVGLSPLLRVSRRIDPDQVQAEVVHCGRLEKLPGSERCRCKDWGLSLSRLEVGNSLEPEGLIYRRTFHVGSAG